MHRFYWDASVFSAWLNKEEGRFDICDAILRAAEEGQVKIVTSAITLVEVFGYSLAELHGGNLSHQQITDKDYQVESLFNAEYIEVVNVDRFIARTARDLRRNHPQLRRKTIDAIHIASALNTEVEELHSYDTEDMLKLSSIGLKIIMPHWDTQLPLLK